MPAKQPRAPTDRATVCSGQYKEARAGGPGRWTSSAFLQTSPAFPDLPVSVEPPQFSWTLSYTSRLLSSSGLLFSGFCAHPSPPWGLHSGPTTLPLRSARLVTVQTTKLALPPLSCWAPIHCHTLLADSSF